MRVTASAPGKLILCGEHAVVYRRPALVAAVDLRLRTRLATPASASPSPTSDALSGEAPVRLRVPSFALDETVSWREVLEYAAAARRRWRGWSEGRLGDAFASVRSDDPAHVLKVALGEAAADLGEDGGPPLEVTVESELPIGSGFGSSAAAAVTLVAAYRALRRGGGPAAAGDGEERRRVEHLAREVERRQHGSHSGVDGATVLHGGLLWAERDDAGDLRFTPFRCGSRGRGGRSPVLDRLAVYDTGTPAEGTGAVVAAVRGRVAREPERFETLWNEIEEATRAFRALLEEDGPESGSDPSTLADSGDRAGGLLRRCQRALEAAGVVPEPVRERIARLEAAGASAKISGAGSLAGPGAGSLLVYHPEARSTGGGALDGLPALAGLRRYLVRLGGPGLEVEVDPEAAGPAGTTPPPSRREAVTPLLTKLPSTKDIPPDPEDPT